MAFRNDILYDIYLMIFQPYFPNFEVCLEPSCAHTIRERLFLTQPSSRPSNSDDFPFFGSPVALLEPDLDCFLDRPRIHRFVDLPRVGSRLMVTMMIFDKSSTILCREQRLKSSGPCRAHRLKIHIKKRDGRTENRRRNCVLQGWDCRYDIL